MTTEPQILDSAGNRLQVGDRVQSRYGRAEVTEVSVHRVRIETLASRRRVYFVPDLPTAAGAYRCNSLTLIPTQEDD